MPFLTAGLWMGAFWAQEAWANYWGWDSKENSALISWLIYIIYIHLRMLGGYRGQKAMAVLMAGGDVRGGQVVGASDAKGAGPASEVFTPEDVAASFYRNMGLDHCKEYHTNTGRPIRLVREGEVIEELFVG